MRLMTLIILLATVLSVNAQDKTDTSLNYTTVIRESILLNYFEVVKEIRKDTIDLKGAFMKIHYRLGKKGRDTLFMPQPIGDTLVVRSSNGKPMRDTVFSFAFNKDVVAFYLMGDSTYNGAIYDQFYFTYPDTRIPTYDNTTKGRPKLRDKRFWDILGYRSMIIKIVKKQPSASN